MLGGNFEQNPSGLNLLATNKISIITNSDIRYEGTLYQINPHEQNIALSNVKSYGTEGRKLQTGGNEIAPTNVVYDYIVFRGTDIKDIIVLNNDNEEKKPVTTQKAPPISNPQPNIVPPKMNQPPVYQKNPAAGVENIDFDEMNQKFQRISIQDYEKKKGEETAKDFGTYAKPNFFDSISNSTTQKNRETREERVHQAEIDKETFGSEFVSANNKTQNFNYRKKKNNYNDNRYRTYYNKNDNRNNNRRFNSSENRRGGYNYRNNRGGGGGGGTGGAGGGGGYYKYSNKNTENYDNNEEYEDYDKNYYQKNYSRGNYKNYAERNYRKYGGKNY